MAATPIVNHVSLRLCFTIGRRRKETKKVQEITTADYRFSAENNRVPFYLPARVVCEGGVYTLLDLNRGECKHGLWLQNGTLVKYFTFNIFSNWNVIMRPRDWFCVGVVGWFYCILLLKPEQGGGYSNIWNMIFVRVYRVICGFSFRLLQREHK